MPEIGKHLLGRNPSPPDPRDFQLSHFLDSPERKLDNIDLDAALAELLAIRWVAKGTKKWATTITEYLKSQNPSPPPLPTDFYWPNAISLDQGNTGHCVGFGWAQWGNTAPVEDTFTNTDGHTLYYECKVIDGEPQQENGSNVRSGAQAMQNRHRLENYAFADTIDEILAWLRKEGPLVAGTDWTDGMFDPDKDGIVHPSGSVAGGHCYVICGIKGDLLEFENSWGHDWGVNGYFYMPIAEWDMKLFQKQGEACTAVELAP